MFSLLSGVEKKKTQKKKELSQNESLDRAMMVKRTSWGSRAMKTLQTSTASWNTQAEPFTATDLRETLTIQHYK